MRLTLCGDRRTSKTTLWYRLEGWLSPQLTLLLHEHSPLHPLAAEWAESREQVSVVLVGGKRVGVLGPRDNLRYVWGELFRLYRPDMLLVFGDRSFLDAGEGPMVRRQVERYGTDVTYTETVYLGKTKTPRTEELCGKPSRSGSVFCGKHKGHPGGWHVHYENGKRKSAWRDADCLRSIGAPSA